MEKIKNNWEENIYKTLENSIILHLPTIEFLLKQREDDAIILFLFYCYCSKLQRNSKRVWCSDNFALKNLKWRKQRLLNSKKKLKDFKIINVLPYKEKSEKSGGMAIKKWFIEIIPLLNEVNILKTSEVPNLRGSHYSPLSGGNHSSIEINNNNSIEINNSIREETSSSTPSSLKEEKNKTKNKETAEFDDTAKTKKEKNSALPVVHEVFSFFRERCKEEFNIVPAIDYGKDGKIIKTRLKVLEVNGVSYKDLINFYLNSADKDRLGLSLSVCFSNVIVNKFLNEVAFERHIKNIKYTKGR